MQQLKIEHKSNNTKQVVSNENKSEEIVENIREARARTLALTKNIFRLQNTDTFYCESESVKDVYYFVRYNPSSVVESWYCSCKDISTRHMKCKHLFTIEFAIKWGTIKDIDKVPDPTIKDVKLDNTITKSYKDDDYTF
jgi:predicted nucleic acid-binding Zn finger protein